MARIFLDLGEAGQDLHRRFSWLGRGLAPGEGSPADRPPMDVLESEAGIEIIVDLPGLDAQAISVTYQDGAVVVSGTKRPTRCHHHHAAFHLAERSFGRFTRAVQLDRAFDASRATAQLSGGELHIAVPRIDERRGRPISIPVATP